MSSTSAIQWTDSTWNPVRGCTKVSPGCKHCYAETFAERWRGVPGHPYEQGFDLRLVPEKLEEPLSWRAPRRIFVNSMSDLFHEEVPDQFIDSVFAVMALAPRHTFQTLTKRPERMAAYLLATSGQGFPVPVPTRRSAVAVAAFHMNAETYRGEHRFTDEQCFVQSDRWPLPNVWLGVSVEDQATADERIPLLLQTPAAVRFVSYEPALGPVDLSRWTPALDWVIAGGESGHGHRPVEVDWIRSVRDQCIAAGVAFFFKQWGGRTPGAGGRLLDGREWNEMPRPRGRVN